MGGVEPSAYALAYHPLYTFEPDIEIIGQRRERRNQLGVALQLALLRHPGITLAQVIQYTMPPCHHATIFEMNVESYRRRVAIQRQSKVGRPPTYATIKTVEEMSLRDNQHRQTSIACCLTRECSRTE